MHANALLSAFSLPRTALSRGSSCLLLLLVFVYNAWGVDALSVKKGQGSEILLELGGEAVDASKTRVYLDIDDDAGTGFGDQGADYMIEGTTFYRYPDGAIDWNWQKVYAVPTATVDGKLVYTFRDLPKFKVLRISVETFDDSWAVVDRYPGYGAISIDSAKLTEAKPADEPGFRAEAYRVGSKGLGIKVVGEELQPERLRVFLNTDGDNTTGLGPFGADYMIEGLTLYRHSGSGQGWDWETQSTLFPDAEDGGVFYRLDDVEVEDTFEFSAEKTDSNWEVLERYPSEGLEVRRKSELKEYSYLRPGGKAGPKNYQIEELLAHVPPSLSITFDERFSGMPWQEVAVEAPKWKPAGADESFDLQFKLWDAKSETAYVLEPARMLQVGEWFQWRGEADGVHWQVIAHPDERGDLDLFARLHSKEERLLRFEIAVKLPMEEWTWHDDVQFRREMTDAVDEYSYTGGSPYGWDGQVSKYPFGVISKGDQSVVLETDLSEPRVFKIAARPEEETLSVIYDVALTPETKKFPGMATFHASFRMRESTEQEAFRDALAELYQNYPALFERRPEAVGLWMPFTDISTIPGAEDFGFAYYEKGGAVGSDVDFAHENGVLTMVYTEPWLYWLPMPAGVERNPETALRLMRHLAVGGFNKANEFASGGLLGAARDADGEIVMTFQDVPWNSGARMEVSTDPELPTRADAPANRAMAEFTFMSEAVANEKVEGIYLDSLSAMFIMDYNPEALAVADYPATYTTEDMKPGLATPIAAYEFIAGLGNYMQARGKFLMGNFPCWNFPFFMPYIDIPGEETHWFHEGHYERLPDHELNYRRAISGQKAWGFLLNGKYDHFEPEYARRYFEDCLFWAFQPSLFSHDAANDPYWENEAWYERDRIWFRRYMPWIQRLAKAGWQPTGPASVRDAAVELEHFYGQGDEALLLTVRNVGDSPIGSGIELELDEPHKDWVVVNPLDGLAGWLLPDEQGVVEIPIYLEGDQVRVLTVFPADELESEIAFLEKWDSGEGQEDRLVDTLRALQAQRELGLEIAIEIPQPAILGVDQTLNVRVSNRSQSPLYIESARLMAAGDTRAVSLEPLEVDPGSQASFLVAVPASFDHDAFVVEFTLSLGNQPQSLDLPVNWTRLNPVAVLLKHDRVITIQEQANIPLSLHNLLDVPTELNVVWSGDFGTGQMSFPLEAGVEERAYLPIDRNSRATGRVQLTADALGMKVFEGEVDLEFLGGQDSLVRDSAVRVETSGDFPGYSPQPLRDGVTRPGPAAVFNQAAWASAESSSAHWVRFSFPEPVEISEVKIYWNHEDGVTYTSREGLVRGVTQDGREQELDSFSNDESTEVTTLTFEPALLSSLEIRQPARGGSESRPNLLWLTEIEVR